MLWRRPNCECQRPTALLTASAYRPLLNQVVQFEQTRKSNTNVEQSNRECPNDTTKYRRRALGSWISRCLGSAVQGWAVHVTIGSGRTGCCIHPDRARAEEAAINRWNLWKKTELHRNYRTEQAWKARHGPVHLVVSPHNTDGNESWLLTSTAWFLYGPSDCMSVPRFEVGM